METYGYCMYHKIECDYKGGCTSCPHNSKEDTEWFMQDKQEMTIDDAIKHYENMKKGWYLVYPERLFDFTIETMRKYQKMQEVLERIWNIPSHLINKEECLDRIMETYREVRDE